ncbi:C4-dicarboxylate ABC transporter substrate-binding protein [Thioclava sp. SK-1]|uniref:TRAP transporter small permease n=1 Tax=Thioclava sp. SK-1 TaxID=1889770 RepID=UPI00082687AC|nr:TRAP transporter small permease subunit [Thioclava sp. SK-1]OCX63785.1 C4-dicarboxylate ABC transporter substrate-binding protein [Thioclava sp. SK-1]
MKLVIATLITIARIATGISFAVIILAVLFQLAGRSGLTDAVVWTEELTRFALLFLAAFGVGLSYRSGNLVNVDIVMDLLPARLAWALRLICAVITFGFGVVLIKSTLLYLSIGARQTAPSLGIRMDVIHASVMVALISLSLFAALRVIEMLIGVSDGTPDRLSEDY